MRTTAGGAGDIEEPERGSDAEVGDPVDRGTPYVEGPTGSAPLSSELHGDPGAHGDRRSEGGAAAGAIAGTAVGGPIGGVVGGLAGGAIGTASVDAPATDADGGASTASDPTDRS